MNESAAISVMITGIPVIFTMYRGYAVVSCLSGNRPVSANSVSYRATRPGSGARVWLSGFNDLRLKTFRKGHNHKRSAKKSVFFTIRMNSADIHGAYHPYTNSLKV